MAEAPGSNRNSISSSSRHLDLNVCSEQNDQIVHQPAKPCIEEVKSQDDNKEYPTGLRLVLIIVSLCISTLLVALDGTIIATAIPTITSDFNSLDDVAWYG
jgi:hypothetical protein